MSPIEEHWVHLLSREFAQHGVAEPAIVARSAEAEDWAFVIESGGRTFEIGFSPGTQLRAREATSGRERLLVSNDHPPVNDSARARELAVRLVAAAIAKPDFPPRDPPVI